MTVSSRAAAIIPARYASTRFPGKPLAEIDGVPMIVRVARQVQEARSIGRILIATDDDRILRTVTAAGFEAVMTPPDCASGTDRVAAAARATNTRAELIVNVQGDEPLIDPADVDALVEETLRSELGMGTLARPMPDRTRLGDPNVVKVVLARDNSALYFSRAPIPSGAANSNGPLPLLHLGLYAYRPEILERLCSLEPTPLERSERLEQLRALENGIKIHVAMARSAEASVAVDTPADAQRVERILRDRKEPQMTRSESHAPRA